MVRALPSLNQWKDGELPREIPVANANSALLTDLCRVWDERRGSATWPEHRSLTPRDMKQYLRHLHMYDVIDNGADFRIRLYGTAMVFDMDRDPTGSLVSQFPHPQIGSRIAEACREVIHRRGPLCQAARHGMDKDGLRSAHLEMVWLPLGPPGSIEQILGATVVTVKEVG